MLDSIIVDKIIKIFQNDTRISAAYLLGSVVSGKMHSGSDIDIALLPAPGNKFDDLMRVFLCADMEMEMQLKLDIGILSSANLVYAKEAILTGREIFVRDRAYTDLMTTTLLGMYISFQDQRSEVLNAYCA